MALAANNTTGEPTTMVYSPDGLVTQMTEPVRANGTRHRETSLSHDRLGRVVVEEVGLVGVDPLTSPAKAFKWTTLGLPKTEVGRLGATQSFAYNAPVSCVIETGYPRSWTNAPQLTDSRAANRDHGSFRV